MVNLPQDYFKPLNRIASCKFEEIECNPITLLVIASYFTFIIPAALLIYSCLKGRVKNEAPAGSPKVDDAAHKALNAEKAKRLVEEGYKHQNAQDPVKALSCFEQAAELNNSEAHHQVGYYYGTGTGTAVDYAKAHKHYLLSQDDSTSCFNLGILYEEGLGCEKNDKKAAEFYQKALNMGFKKAAIPLAEMYEFGRGVEKDHKKAFEIVDAVENLFNKEASIKLAIYYYYGIGCEVDFKQALNIFSFNKNEPVACFFLGLMHLHGKGVQMDQKKAFELMTQAKELGYIEANLELGKMYFYGIGTEKNDKEAFACIQASYQPDNLRANYWLGFFYMTGTGAEIDLKKAREYLDAAKMLNPNVNKTMLERLECLELLQNEEDPVKLFDKGEALARKNDEFKLSPLFFIKAADKGHREAQYRAGLLIEEDDKKRHYFELAAAQGESHAMYELGEIEEDPKASFEWYQKAADKGLEEAQYELGFCYLNGKGCQENENKGYELIQKAADSENYISVAAWEMGLRYEALKDYAKSLHYYKKAADKNDDDANVRIATFYAKGLGIPADPEIAFKMLLDAASKKNAEAYYYLSYHYKEGFGTDKDLSKAFESISKAYELDSEDLDIIKILGLFILRGVGCVSDTNKARELFEEGKALDKDEFKDCFEELALWETFQNEEDPEKLFTQGSFLTSKKKYPELSLNLFERAANKNFKPAQDYLKQLGQDFKGR